MNWPKRLKQWSAALALEKRSAGKIPWLTMAFALWSGVVPRGIWRNRLKNGCFKCPLYSIHFPEGAKKRTDAIHLCKSTHPDLLGAGCGCAVNIVALTANPYGNGCVGRSIDPELGWGPYRYPSRWAQVRAVVDFVLYPLHKRANKFQPRIPPRQF